MKFIPKTRQGSLILSAIDETIFDEAVARRDVPENVKANVKKYFRSTIQALEEDPKAQFDIEDAKIAALFFKWISALHAGNKVLADQCEADIDASVKNNPFPYSETKYWFEAASGKIEQDKAYASAKKIYRNWKTSPGGGGKKDFGVIEATISETAKIAVIGDWGTGTSDSFLLFKQMMERDKGIEAILHLGDIYQAGTPFECAQNFLNPIEKMFKDEGWPRLPILTIPGNHEYFTFGKGYFSLIDVLNHDLPKWKQEASYFCLRSSKGNWQFLGADTGIGCIEHPKQPGIEDSEMEWHADKLDGFKGRTVFMTHHQFVSAYGTLNDGGSGDSVYYNARLLGQLGPELSSIQLWMWGHDHWFTPYAKDLTIPGQAQILQRGQLLGGSAREVTRTPRVVYPATDDSKGSFTPAQSNPRYYNHTYAIIDLATATINYYQSPAWDEDNPPNPINKAVPPGPLFQYKIAAPK